MAKTGVFQYVIWDEQSGSPTYVSPGLVVGGEAFARYDDAIRRGIGGQALFSAGGMRFGCNLDLEITNESKPLLQYAIRASYPAGALTEVMVKAGTDAVDFLYENAVVNRLRVSGEPEAPFRASLEILAKKETETAVGDAVEAIAGQLMDWYLGSVVIASNPYDCVGFDLELSNGCDYLFDLDAKSSNVKRLPTAVKLGTEEVRLTVRLRDKLVFDVDADNPSRAIAAVIVGNDGTNSITFTFSNLAHTGGRPMPLVGPDDDVVWAYELTGKQGSLAIT